MDMCADACRAAPKRTKSKIERLNGVILCVEGRKESMFPGRKLR